MGVGLVCALTWVECIWFKVFWVLRARSSCVALRLCLLCGFLVGFVVGCGHFWFGLEF